MKRTNFDVAYQLQWYAASSELHFDDGRIETLDLNIPAGMYELKVSGIVSRTEHEKSMVVDALVRTTELRDRETGVVIENDYAVQVIYDLVASDVLRQANSSTDQQL